MLYEVITNSIPAEERTRLRREAERILVADVYPAYRSLLEYLEQTYLGGARETIGLSAMPNGKNWYAYNARSHTTTDLTPKEIHEIDLAEVRITSYNVCYTKLLRAVITRRSGIQGAQFSTWTLAR